MPTDWGDLLYPDLAEKWEVVDEINWTFHIRPGVRFHNLPPVNGREAVAGDIVYSYKRLESLPGGALAGWSEWIDRYEAPEDRILSVHTKKPYSYIFMSLGSPRLAVVPKEAVEQFGDLKSKAIGTGPFILRNWGQSQGIEVERNPDYDDRQVPYIDGLKWSVMPDDSSIQAAFRSGAVDLYGAPDKLRAESVSSVKGGYRSQIPHPPIRRACYQRLPLPRVRRRAGAGSCGHFAGQAGHDRQATSGRWRACRPGGPILDHRSPAGRDTPGIQERCDEGKAVADGGRPGNLHFSLACSNYMDNADRAAIIRQNLAEAGIKADIDVRELGTWLRDLYAVNYEATTFAHLAYLSDDIQLQSHYSTGFNRAMFLGITDHEVDALLEQVQSTIDETARKEVALEVQRKILERHGPTLVLYEPYGYLVAYDYTRL